MRCWISCVSWSLNTVAVSTLLQTNSRPDWLHSWWIPHVTRQTVTHRWLFLAFTDPYLFLCIVRENTNRPVINRQTANKIHITHTRQLQPECDPQAWLSFSAFYPELLKYGWLSCFYIYISIWMFLIPPKFAECIDCWPLWETHYMRLFCLEAMTASLWYYKVWSTIAMHADSCELSE